MRELTADWSTVKVKIQAFYYDKLVRSQGETYAQRAMVTWNLQATVIVIFWGAGDRIAVSKWSGDSGKETQGTHHRLRSLFPHS